MGETDLVLVETADRVRTITLHRPEARNALSRALQRAATAALAAADDDPDVDVVVLTGSDPAFCAGLDLKELGAGEQVVQAEGGDPGDGRPRDPINFLFAMTKPVIGAVNGPAITGGFELALGCDFLVASERARFGDSHARVGFTPAGRMSVNLPLAVGVRRAKEMSLTGRFLDAAEAHRLGLVNHVVAHHELLPFCRSLAAEIVANDQDAVRTLKRLYDENALLAGGDAVEHELEVFRGRRLAAETIEARRRAVVERGRNA